MGEAKRRGTFEQRRAAAIAREEEAAAALRRQQEEKQRQLQAEWDALPEEEKEKHRAKARERQSRRIGPGLLSWVGASAAMAFAFQPVHRAPEPPRRTKY